MKVVHLRPPGYDLDEEVVATARARAAESGGSVEITDDVDAAYRGAHAVCAKSYGSTAYYGRFDEEKRDKEKLRGRWIVDAEKMGRTDDAIFMHCLPIRRNVKATDAVLDGPRSVVVDQAENRMWAQLACCPPLSRSGGCHEEPSSGAGGGEQARKRAASCDGTARRPAQRRRRRQTAARERRAARTDRPRTAVGTATRTASRSAVRERTTHPAGAGGAARPPRSDRCASRARRPGHVPRIQRAAERRSAAARSSRIAATTPRGRSGEARGGRGPGRQLSVRAAHAWDGEVRQPFGAGRRAELAAGASRGGSSGRCQASRKRWPDAAIMSLTLSHHVERMNQRSASRPCPTATARTRSSGRAAKAASTSRI